MEKQEIIDAILLADFGPWKPHSCYQRDDRDGATFYMKDKAGRHVPIYMTGADLLKGIDETKRAIDAELERTPHPSVSIE